jgi:hypothetical protein
LADVTDFAMSDCDHMHFGLIACRDLMPALDLMADYVLFELQLLQDAVSG